jgi:hypothetical protein
MGVGSTAEQLVANIPLSADTAAAASQQQKKQEHMEGMQMAAPQVSKDANAVPGFPQDAFMEGPMMAMDKMLDKPENFGLRPGWSGFIQGMMTFVRVPACRQIRPNYAASRETERQETHADGYAGNGAPS